MLLRLVACLAAATTLAAAADARGEGPRPDCKQAGDGYYAPGCSASFWRCVNDRLYTYDCPKGLYFNPTVRKCEYHDTVPICKERTAKDAIVKASAEFNCTGMKDGAYKPKDIACSNTFVTCFNGYAIEQACPYNQFYNEGGKACDFRARVPSCPKSSAKIAGFVPKCPPLRTDLSSLPSCPEGEVCEKASDNNDGSSSCKWPLRLWYGSSESSSLSFWTVAPEGLLCGSDGKWHADNDIINGDAVICMASKDDIASAAEIQQAGACISLITEHSNVPCEVDEICQEIGQPKNGRYSCETPFTVWYGPLGLGTSQQWKEAKNGLRCGSDGKWYDGERVVQPQAVDCTAKKSSFGSTIALDTQDTSDSSCPPLFTDEAEIPCLYNTEICREIGKPINGRYACETPYIAWVGPRGLATGAQWITTPNGLTCGADGRWYNGAAVIPADYAVDCTAQKKNCSSLPDGSYNGDLEGRCSGFFWNCANKDAFLYKCPQGLFFDEPTAECDYKEFITACGGNKPNAIDSAISIPSGFASADAQKIACMPLVTDEREIPCEKDEVCREIGRPVNGRYICESPFKVWIGMAGNKDSDTWKMAEHGLRCGSDGRWYNGEEVITETGIDCTAKKPDCASESEVEYKGVAESSCSSYFWHCSNGRVDLLKCPERLFFNLPTKKCDFKESVLACGGQKIRAISANSSPSSAVADQNCAPLITDQRQIPCDVGDICQDIGRPDKGRYSCEPPFKLWVGPAGSVDSTGWSIAENGLRCGRDGKWYSGQQEITQTAVDCTAEKFDCSSRPDGEYNGGEQSECSRYFWRCSSGSAELHKCPESLFFNEHARRCDMMNAVPTCSNKKIRGGAAMDAAVPPAGSSIAVPSPLFECSERPDGFYPESKCTKRFWQCSGGMATSLVCPSGLVYDSKAAVCQYREACEKDTAGPPAPPPPAPSEIVPAMDHGYINQPAPLADTPSFDCKGRSDGLYSSAPCQPIYFQCVNGRSFAKNCQTGLVYNEPSQSCDYIDNCRSTPSTVLPTAALPSPTQPATPANSAPLPSCASIADGAHALTRCGQQYFSCWRGATTLSSCGSGLIFNPRTGQCDYRVNVVECSGQASDTILQPTAAPLSSPTKAPIDNFCLNLSDGFYGSGCENFFHSCIAKKAYKMYCPLGLYYNPSRRTCDHRESIVECGGKPSDASYGASTSPRPVSDSPLPAPTAAPLPPPAIGAGVAPIPANFCAGKTDGIYGIPRCTKVRQCSYGVVYLRECKFGLWYNTANGLCDYRENVADCRGQKASDALPTRPPPVQPVPTKQPTYIKTDPQKELQQKPLIAASPEAVFCSSLADGYYAQGCSDKYIACLGGSAVEMTCPSSLRYSTASQACDYPDSVPECGGSAPAPPAAVSDVPRTSLPEDTSYSRFQPQPTSPPSLDSSECSSKSDGIYSAGPCTSKYIACVAGRHNPGECREGLIFSASSGLCDYRENVPTCPEFRSKFQPIQPLPVVAASPPLQTSSSGSQSSCDGQRNGLIAAGTCSPFYNRCSGGRLVARDSCQAGLIFNQANGQCDYKERVSECSSPARAAPSPPLSSAAFCRGRPDGAYGSGCSRDYVICTNGAWYPFSCQSGLFFAQDRSTCEYASNVKECGGRPRY